MQWDILTDYSFHKDNFFYFSFLHFGGKVANYMVKQIDREIRLIGVLDFKFRMNQKVVF